ncbi:MAG: RNA recognition motif domain-containing protein [Dehalococcoidia bacterium]
MAQRIYVGNLPFDATERDLQARFAEYGNVMSIAIPTDRETGQARGFGFVEMAGEDAAKAIAGLNGSDFGGRSLTVNEAREREARGHGSEAGPRR